MGRIHAYDNAEKEEGEVDETQEVPGNLNGVNRLQMIKDTSPRKHDGEDGTAREDEDPPEKEATLKKKDSSKSPKSM